MEWAYRIECIDRRAGLAQVALGRALPGRASGTAIIAQMMALGTRVDSCSMHISALGAAAHLVDDALLVHDAVLALDSPGGVAVVLVIMHARSGTRPPWHGAEAERLVAEVDARGRLVTLREHERAIACYVRPAVDPAIVEYTRAEYGVWWEALAALTDVLRGRLEGYEVCGPAAEREPWAGDASIA